MDITLALRKWARQTKGVVLAACLQPTPEVFELFDNLLLLRDGHMIYNGPRASAAPYISSTFNIRFPKTRDYADFIFEFLVDPKVSPPLRLQLGLSSMFINCMNRESLSTIEDEPQNLAKVRVVTNRIHTLRQ